MLLQRQDRDRRRKNETLTQEQSHSTGEKLTDGARVIKHEELRFVSSQKTARKKKKKTSFCRNCEKRNGGKLELYSWSVQTL